MNLCDFKSPTAVAKIVTLLVFEFASIGPATLSSIFSQEFYPTGQWGLFPSSILGVVSLEFHDLARLLAS